MTEINVNASEVSRAIREMEARADIEAENARAELIAQSDAAAEVKEERFYERFSDVPTDGKTGTVILERIEEGFYPQPQTISEIKFLIYSCDPFNKELQDKLHPYKNRLKRLTEEEDKEFSKRIREAHLAAAKGKRKSQLIFYDGDFNQSSAAHFGMRNMSKVYHNTRESQYFRGITKTTSITEFYVNEAYKPDEEKPWHCDAHHYCVMKVFNAVSTFASFNTEDEANAFANEIGLVQSTVTDMLTAKGEQQ